MIRDWDIVTSYQDSVGTTDKVVTFTKVQDNVKVTNQGNANMIYTVGSKSGTLTPNQSVNVKENLSSFTIRSVSGVQTFEVWAKEAGTEQAEDNSTDVMTILADNSTQITNLNNVVNPDPVTFTVSASGAAPTNSVFVQPANSAGVIDSRFIYRKSSPVMSQVVPNGAFVYAVRNGYNTAPSRQHSLEVRFTYYGQSLEVRLISYNGSKYRIKVNGKPLTAEFQSPPATDGKMFNVKLSFAKKAHRDIIVEIADSIFPGVQIGSTDLIYAPPKRNIPKAVALGDSVTQGQNNDASVLEIWPTYLGEILGWDIWDQGEGGTGWVNPGSLQPNRNFQGRIPVSVTGWNPDYVIFAGGLNDQDVNGYTSSQRRSVITSTLNDTVAAAPNAKIIVLGPFYDKPEAGVDVVNDDIEAVATTFGSNVFFIPTKDIITLSNQSQFISNDGIHPIRAGHELWGRILATQITSKLGLK